ncbi:hypothetical protein [Actinomadura litoris]|uniref:Uncharacterized protein n=1 Tax=Actinomadura litoris TaxID=2678616 RepID=A0A7K1L394_9ACTN|nr:hypothetical protein [Actinomadura litoris]MUN38773.1 hypothetical protein [Actinomadura litoris]
MTAADAASRGETTLVLYGEGAGEAARRMLPALPDACFTPVDLDELTAAVEHGLAQVVLVAGLDEQAALAPAGSDVLGSITRDMDGGPALSAEVAGAPRRAYELWEAAGKLGPCGRELCRRTAGELERRAARAAGSAESPIAAQVVLVDSTGQRMVGMFGRMAR